MKRLIILLLAIALLAFSIAFIFCRPEEAVVQPEIEQVRENYSNENRNFELDLAYPKLKGLEEKTQEEINEAIKSFVTKTQVAFEQNVLELGSLLEGEGLEGIKSQLSIDYQTTLQTDKYLSFYFDIYSYIAGAAHPFPLRRGLSFDLETGEELLLQDLFAENVSYLEFLSEKAIFQLNEKINPDGYEDSAQWIEDGAGAKQENYQEFYLDSEGLNLIFNVYQVGAYALGTQEIKITYTDLKTILKEDIVNSIIPEEGI